MPNKLLIIIVLYYNHIDKGKGITIRRSFDDNTALLAVTHGTLLFTFFTIEFFDKTIMKNNNTIIVMFVMTLEFELFAYLSVWNAKRDTAKALNNNK